MNNEEREYLRQRIADFRYSVVAELCNPYLEAKKKREMIQDKAAMTYTIPGSKKHSISPETIRSWATKYRLHGKKGLLPKQREDRGRPRSISDEETALIIKRLERQPQLTATAVLRQLQQENLVREKISSSALSRLISANDLKRKKRLTDQDQRRFAFESPLACVQADAMHGFSVPDGKGRRRKAILMAFIDDATRRILYARFEFSEKSLIFEDGIRHILKAHGKIGRLYADNGSSFVSNQTKRIIETLGIYITHSKPYRPQGRGKVERFFRTVRQSFLRLQQPESIESLEQLNHLFHTWLETEYHRKTHSSLGITPLEAWLSKSNQIKHVDPLIDIDRAFFHQTTRKVYKDSVVSVNGIAFEVPPLLIGKRVNICYDAHPPLLKISITYNSNDYGEAHPVDIYANTKVKRNSDFDGELTPIESPTTQFSVGGLL